MRIYVLILWLLLTQIISAQVNVGKSILAKTDAPVFMKSEGTNLVMTKTEYENLMAKISDNPNFIKIRQKPLRLKEPSYYGINLVIGGKNICWMLEGNETDGFKLYADWNADGNLRNDKPVKFKKIGDTYSYKKILTETVDGKPHKYPYQMEIELAKIVRPTGDDEKLALRVSDGTIRDGILNIENQQLKFRIFGQGGIYDYETNSIYFDFNGDGKFDTQTRYSPEYYKVREKYINIGDKTYEFTVDRYGDQMTLKPHPQKLPDRADLSEGSPAPDFAFKTLDGKSYKLSAFRGKIVLLDIWGLWCAPCVAEAPSLAQAYQKLKDKGFEIISLDQGDKIENLQKFIVEKQMNWTHTQTDDEFISLYRIDRYPSYFLLDKDGKIISNSMRAGEEMYRKIEELLKSESNNQF